MDSKKYAMKEARNLVLTIIFFFFGRKERIVGKTYNLEDEAQVVTITILYAL